jgi:hypothetical protein
VSLLILNYATLINSLYDNDTEKTEKLEPEQKIGYHPSLTGKHVEEKSKIGEIYGDEEQLLASSSITTSTDSRTSDSAPKGNNAKIQSGYSDPRWGDSGSEWRYRKNITINHTKVSANLINFPVLIDLHDADLHDDAQASGGDILFTDSAGNKLDHEIDVYESVYSPNQAHLVAWVKTNLSSLQDTVISMYYGNPTVVNQENPDGVWDEYKGVWHFSETSGNTLDSTSYGTDGSLSGGITQGISGQIGNVYEFNGIDGAVNMGDPADGHLDFGTGSFTASVWVLAYNTSDSNQGLIYKGGTSSDEAGYVIEISNSRSDFDFEISNGTGGGVSTSDVNLTYGMWTYIVAVVNRSDNTITVYKDGSQVDLEPDISSVNNVDTYYDLEFSTPSDPVNGSLDEIRVSSGAYSADWIATEFNNQNDTSSFYKSIGMEETKGSDDWPFKMFKYRKNITIDSTNVSSTLNDFPFLIDLYDSDLHDYAQNDGDDIFFTDISGNKLAHEIDSYTKNTTHIHLVAWVKIPTLDASNDTTIIMYYGNSASPSQEKAGRLWDEYMGVWHLGEDVIDESSATTVHEDSTSNGNHGDQYSNSNTVGKIGGAQDFDGNSDYIDLGNDKSLQITGNLTIEAWVKASVLDTSMGIGGKYKINTEYGFSLTKRSNNEFRYYIANGGSSGRYDSDIPYNDIEWHHVVGVRRGGTNLLYIDGVEQADKAMFGLGDSGQFAFIGRRYSDSDDSWWNGSIDEFRFSNVGRSADWIATQYKNQLDPENFIIPGEQEEYDHWWKDGSFMHRKDIAIDNEQLSIPEEEIILRPTGDGSVKGLIVSGAINNWEAVDEIVNDEDSTRVYTSSSSYMYDLYETENAPIFITGEISKVTVYYRVRSIVSSGDNARAYIKVDGVPNYGNDQSLGNSYTTYSHEWLTNPVSGQEWTWTDINAMEIGVGLKSADDTCRATQVYAIVSYKMNIMKNFPVLIDIDSPDLKSGEVKADGADILFMDENGVRLSHEIESFNQTTSTGHLIAWVKLPMLKLNTSTILSMYYSAISELSSQEEPEAVWNNNYVGVWHLDELSGGTNAIKDATANENDGTNFGVPSFNSTGQIGNSIRFDGSTDYIQVADDDSFHISDAITIEAWINPDDVGSWHTIISKYTGFNADLNLGTVSNGFTVALYPIALSASVTINMGQWQHLVATYDGSVVKLFLDGVLIDSSYASDTLGLASNTNPLYIGFNTAFNDYFDGFIDETRISKIERSYTWIDIGYQNQYDPSGFITVGQEHVFDAIPPIVDDFGIEDLGTGIGKFWAKITDTGSSVDSAKIDINGTEYSMSRSNSTHWIYQQLVNWQGNYEYQITNATDAYNNSITTTTSTKNHTFNQDKVAPAVDVWIYDPDTGDYGTFRVNVSDTWGEIDTVIVNVTFMDNKDQSNLWAVMQNTASGYVNDTLILVAGTIRFVITVNDTKGNSFTSSEHQGFVPIVNHAPIAGNLTLSRDQAMELLPVYSNSTLYLDYDYYDEDGNDEGGTEIRWYKNNVLQNTYNDQIEVPFSALVKGDQWNATVKPKDGQIFGNLNATGIITIQNTAPEITNVIITTPGSPFTTVTLTADYDYSDNDGDGENTGNREILWYKDANLQVNLNDSTAVLAGNTSKNEEWYYRIKVNDGTNYSSWVMSSNLTILNSLPIASDLNIENAGNLYTDDDLVANWTFSDADGDSQTAYYILWYKNGIIQPLLNNSMIITAGNTSKDQSWKFELIVNDGTTNSSVDWIAAPSSSATPILNTVPEASGLTITTPPYTTDNLAADWNYTDADNDIQSSYLIRWYKNGVLQPSLNDSMTVSASLTSKGETWNYTLQVSDGDDYSIVYDSTSVTILNSIPTASGLTITTTPYNTTNLVVGWMFADSDTGDSQVDYIIYWYRDGALQSHLDNKTTVEAGNTTKGEVWNYTLLVYDDESWSVAYNSTSTTILNSKPTTTGLNIENTGNLYTDSNLVANWTFSDIDTDSQVEFYIWWYKNGIIQPSLNNSKIVNAGNTTKDQAWKFELVVYDGEDNSSLVPLASPVTILNTLPGASGLTITTTPYTIDDLDADWLFNDIDGGDTQVSYLVRWYKNGILQPSLNDSMTVSASLTSKGEAWNYTLQVSDGDDYSLVYNSTSVMILNSIPTASGLTITTTPYNTTNLVVGWMFADSDTGDSQADYIIYWYRDGALQSHLDNRTTVEAGNTTKGEAWNYTLLVYDDESWSVAYNSTSTTILNSIPTTTGLNIENTGNLYTDSNLVANWTFSDIDTDSQVEFYIWWYKNGIIQPSLNNSKIVNAGNTTKDQAWKFELVVYDGEDNSTLYSLSSPVQILNTAPMTTGESITSNPNTTSQLVASWTFDDDDTGDVEISYLIRWYKGGILQPALNDSDTVSSSLTTKGEEWNYTLQVYDGEDYSIVYNSSTVTILNSVPTITGLTITSTPYNTTDLEASWTFVDDDSGDSQTDYYIRWYKDNALQSQLDNKTTIGAANTTKGEQWNFTLQVYDGESWSIIYNSSIVEILNSAPTIIGTATFNKTISVLETDTLNITYSYSDPDFDSEGSPIVYWYMNNASGSYYIQSKDNQTILYSTDTSDGDFWYYILRVNDGFDYSGNYTSVGVSINFVNGKPEALNVQVISDLYTTDDLVGSYVYSDPAENHSEAGTLYAWYWFNSSSGKYELQHAYNDTLTLPWVATSKGDQWKFSVRPKDGLDYSVDWYNSSAVTILNTLPTASGLILTSNPYNTTNLVANWTFADIDGDSQADYYIRWYKDNVLQSQLDNKTTIEAANTTKGEVWNYTLQVQDGEGWSSFYNSGNTTVLNTVPAATGLTITANPYTTTDLFADWTFSDPVDNDNQYNYTVRWYKNGELQVDLNDTMTVEAGNTTKGENWKYTVQVHDGDEWSIIYISQTVSILNTVPEASNVDLTTNPSTTDDLVADWTPSDVDGDDVVGSGTYLTRWYKDGVLQASLNDSITVVASLTTKGEEWNYTLQVFDGSDYSTIYNSSTITILNSLPTAHSLTITSNPYNTTDIIVGWSFADNNTGDNQDSFEIRWYMDGVLQSHLNNKVTVEAGNTTKGEEWNYTLRVHDGESYSIYYNSTTVTILNSVPTATGLTIENAGSLLTVDNLVANWTFNDVDLDSQSNYNITWFKNGELQGNLNDTITVGSGNTTKGESWKFTLQVHDGEDWSITYTSQTTSILNTAPEASNVDLTSNPFTTDDMVATWDYNDNDNDSQSPWLIHWYKDGDLQPLLNDSKTISSSLTSKGEDWNYTLQVFDGSDYSIVYNSSITTILNSLPTASGLTITLTPYNTTDLMISWTFGDDNTGDNQDSYEIRWYRNGMLQSNLNDNITIEADNTTKGEEWNYTLRVHDGETYSIYYNSTTVTILNSEPTVTGYIIENAGNLRTTDNLVANWTFSDLDLDSQDNYYIRWYWNGILQGDLNDTKIVDAGNTTKGENWKFTLQVYDGEVWSTTYSSPTASILNSIPSISGFTFSSLSPTTADDLSISYTFNDDNGDLEFGSQIRWYLNNTLQLTFNDSKIIEKIFLAKGDNWNVSIKVSDGIDFSNWFNASVTIVNAAPVITGSPYIYTPPAGLHTTNILVANWNEYDADGDTIIAYQISWYYRVGITEYYEPALDGFTEVPSSYTSKDQYWHFEVNFTDGTDWSQVYPSFDALISNSKPTIDNITLTGGKNTTDDITLSYDFYDADGDPDSSTINWRIFPATLIPGNNTLSSSNFVAGDNVYVIITPNDGFEVGIPVDSSLLAGSNKLVQVGDSAPQINTSLGYPGILSDHPNGTLRFSANSLIYVNYTHLVVDIDSGESGPNFDVSIEINDIIQYATVYRIIGAEYRWYWYNSSSSNYDLQEHLTSSYVDPYYIHGGDQWMASIRPRDTYGNFGNWENSTFVIIGNNLPYVSGITLLPDKPTTSDDVSITYGYVDFDDDPEGMSRIQWYVNGGEIPSNENQTTLSSDFFVKGDTIYVVITPHDGAVYGPFSSSTVITVVNSVPEAGNYRIVNGTSLWTNNNLVANWTFNDYDTSDNQTSILISWYRDDILQTHLNNYTVVGYGNISRDDDWYFTLQVYDGWNLSVIYTSAEITILNSQMVITSATINDNATTAYADQVLIVNYSRIDLDNDIDLYQNITWHVNGVHIAIHDNKTSIDPIYLVKGDEWSYVISIADVSRSWSNVYNSSTILIINSKPRVSGIVFVFDNIGINPINNSREFLIEDEQLNITYTFSDVDADPDDSIIYWYRNGELQNSYTNMTVLPTNITSPGETWKVIIIPHDGVEAGSQAISINITIEGRPVIHDYAIEPLRHNEGTYDFWAETNVVNNSITRMEYLITVIALDLTTDIKYAAPNGTIDFWAFEDFSILELLDDPADFKDLIGTNVTINVTVITTVTYSSVDYLIKTYFSYTFIIEDNAPPRVELAGFSWNDNEQPTNITFYALVQEYGSDIDFVTLLFYFKQVSGEDISNGNGASFSLNGKYYQDISDFNDFNSTTMIFNGTHYLTTVDYTPTQDTEVYFTVRVADQAGNVNGNAYPDGIDPQNVRDKVFRYIVPFNLMDLIPFLLGFIVIAAIVSFIAIKKFSGTELVGLDIDRVMASINEVSDEEIKLALNDYTLGVVISFFDQAHGPIPVLVEPTILRDNFERLLDLSDRSFSASRFVENFIEEKLTTFEFSLAPGFSTESLTFGYSLERPEKRGGAENITLNILVHSTYLSLISQFSDEFSDIVHEIHILMDKSPEKKESIANKVIEIRKKITSIVLTYEKLYGPVEASEEE